MDGLSALPAESGTALAGNGHGRAAQRCGRHRAWLRITVISAVVAVAAGRPAQAVMIALDDIVIERGGTGTLRATLITEGASVAGVEMTLRLASGLAPVLRDDGTPDCTADPTGKTVFATVRHEGGSHCTRPYDCNVVRLVLLSLSDSAPIADGALFACGIAVDPQVGIFVLPLHVVHVAASDPYGVLQPAAGIDAVVTVPFPPTAIPFDTATPTATRSQGPTSTAITEGVRTRKPTSTRLPSGIPATGTPATTPTATSTVARPGGGCAIAAPDDAQRAFAAGLVLLLALRRVRSSRSGGRRAPRRRRRDRAGRSDRARAIRSRGGSRPGPRRGG